MGEKVGQIAKVPEVKKSSSNSRVRKTERLQSMDTTVDRILYLQRTVGNQAVSRLMRSGALQAKLRIGQPGDMYEQEADSVAEQVMRAAEPRVQRQPIDEEEEEPLQAKFTSGLTGTLQTKPETPQNNTGMSDHLKSGLENLSNMNLSNVRVHHNSPKPAQLNALAYTQGQDIHVGSGQEKHLPHEGWHAVQQMQGRVKSTMQAKRVSINDDEALEREADVMGAKALQMTREEQATTGSAHHGAVSLQRKGESEISSETGKRLLVHELTHLVQQSIDGGVLQRKSCPSHRPKGEKSQSEKPAGILTNNTIFKTSDNKLFIQDFAVNDNQLPPGVITSSAWQRVMSIIAGTPSLSFVGVIGYADCLGTEKRNSMLRDERAKAVFDVMPPVVQVKVLFHMGDSVTSFVAPNDTAENRAKNRGVVIKIVKATGPEGKDLCDFLAVASDLDQYMFLVRCLEDRLGLTSATDAPKTLSVLRQIYYGNASWTSPQNRNKIWNDVITQRPWSPGDDPTPKLGKTLFKALQKSKQVFNDGQMLDIGHLLTGMDAMQKPQTVSANIAGGMYLDTNVANHEWATWAGDVGSAAAYHTFCVSFINFTSTYGQYFKNFASDSDLEGDIDSYANWAWLDSVASSPELQLNKPLSEVLMQYYRLTNTKAGRARAGRFDIFINFYGGDVKSGKITKRSQLIKNLSAPINEFALLFLGKKIIKTYQGTPPTACIGNPPKSNPGRSVSIMSLVRNLKIVSDKMTKLFVDWLEKKL
jgi:outer membrane protein OmpA-like peptidoglycan-associated protein